MQKLKARETSITEEIVKTVLTKYNDVFDWPEELPPKRAIEHHIHLKKKHTR